jgi:hypothetical protein
MPGNILQKYAASVALTVTNLHSLASDSGSYLAGWSSASVNNTSNAYLDYLVGGTFTTHASNRAAGDIRVYVIAALNDTPTWPATASGTIGTEGALSFTDTEERDSLCRLLTVLTADTSASSILAFPPTGIAQLFGGMMPAYWALFVTQNVSTAGLAAAGSAIYHTPVYAQYT